MCHVHSQVCPCCLLSTSQFCPLLPITISNPYTKHSICLHNCNCLLSGLPTSTSVRHISSPPNYVNTSNEPCDGFPEAGGEDKSPSQGLRGPAGSGLPTPLSGLQLLWPLPVPGACPTPTCHYMPAALGPKVLSSRKPSLTYLIRLNPTLFLTL